MTVQPQLGGRDNRSKTILPSPPEEANLPRKDILNNYLKNLNLEGDKLLVFQGHEYVSVC